MSIDLATQVKREEWESSLLSSSSTLQDAINVLENSGGRIGLVVGTKNTLLGTVTDGDVRRALLKAKGLDTSVSKIMNSAPVTVTEGAYTREDAKTIMAEKKVLHLPIVNRENCVVGLKTVHDILNKKKFDNPVFLMAGGFGTRLRPLTNDCPKPMLKVAGKPMLEIILNNFIKSGFYRFYISTHYLPDVIRDYFGDGSKWGVSIQYVHEIDPLGTGGALGLLPKDEINHPMFMMNCDILTNLDFGKLIEFHQQNPALATMCVREYKYQIPYGVIQSDGHTITSMEEKPVRSFHINAGIYLIEPELVKSVERGTKVDKPTLLKNAMESGKKINMFPLHEYWLDIGRMEDFNRAQEEAAALLG